MTAAITGDAAQLRFRDPARAHALVAALRRAAGAIGRERVSLMHVCGSHEQAIARLRPSRGVAPRARRDHGAGVPGVRHRHARGRRGRGARAAGRARRHLRRHGARPGHGQVAGRRPRRRRQGPRRLQHRPGGGARTAVQRGSRVLRDGLRDHRRRDRGGHPARSAAELLRALRAQVRAAGNGDRRARSRTRTSRGSWPPATRPSSRGGASSRVSSSATACRSSWPGSSRSTYSRRS